MLKKNLPQLFQAEAVVGFGLFSERKETVFGRLHYHTRYPATGIGRSISVQFMEGLSHIWLLWLEKSR